MLEISDEQIQLIFDHLATDPEKVDDMVKFYWNTALKISGFYVVAIGSLLSFYATHLNDKLDKLWMIPVFCTILSIILILFIVAIKYFAIQIVCKSLDEVKNHQALVNFFWIKLFPLGLYCLSVLILAVLTGVGCSCLQVPNLILDMLGILIMLIFCLTFLSSKVSRRLRT